MVGVILCSNARRLSAASSLSTSAIRMSAARTSCTLKQVSSTSDEVMPCVHEARLRADDLGEVGEEGDDVVLDLALDRVDARDVERRPLLPLSQIVFAAAFGMMPSSAMASAACASISNQMRKRVCGSQIAAISGRV